MQCILRKNHKNHDILSLDEASTKVKDNFLRNSAKIADVKKDLLKEQERAEAAKKSIGKVRSDHNDQLK